MAKRYGTTYSNGYHQETSNHGEAYNFRNYDDKQKFFLCGKQVSVEEFYAAVRTGLDAAWERKNKTHKQVRALYGSSAACYVLKWVLR